MTMNPMRTTLFVLLSAFAGAAQAPDGTALLGSWRSRGEDQEHLEFRPGGILLVDGEPMRYRTAGHRITLQLEGGSIAGTWRLAGSVLTLTLLTQDGDARSERYFRLAADEPEVFEHGLEGPAEDGEPASTPDAERRAGRTASAGPVQFTLPPGFSVMRRQGDLLVLSPGRGGPQAAAVLVLSDALAAAERELPIEMLLRGRLPALAADLAPELEVDARGARVRACALAKGSAAEARLAGTTSDGRPMTVWVGAVRGEAHCAGVLLVASPGQEVALLPGARQVLGSMRFVATGEPNATATEALSGAALAGLQFSASSFYGGSGSTTTVYTFGEAGTVQQRRMCSTEFGDTDSTTPGTYTLQGDTLTMQIGESVVEATLERASGEVVALQIGSARYTRS